MASASSLRHVRHLSTTSATTTTTTPLSISQAKSKLRSEFDPDKALQIYTSSSPLFSSSSSSSSRYAQALTIRRLVKSLRFSDIESLLESHKADPKIKEEPFLCTLIRSYGLAGMFDHALRTFHQMDLFGTPRSSLSFNALLSACDLSKNYERIPVLFRDVPLEFRVFPDEVSYGILVKSYCEVGDMEKAAETVREMERREVRVSLVTFCTLLSCFYKRGRVDDAERLWREMVEKGVELDVVAYNVRIMHVQKTGEAERVKELIDEMESLGLKPDTVSYNYLMNCYCRSGRMEEAKRVYEQLERYGCNPNVVTFRVLIQSLCESGDFEAGYKVFKKSMEKHKIPDFDTLNNLVHGLVLKQNNVKEAKGLIRSVKKKSHPGLVKAWEEVERKLQLRSAKNVRNGEEEED